MRIAIFSDIHGNLEALKVILDKTKNYDKIIFAGDLIGIGPNSKECLELIFQYNVEYLMGNHEQYLIEGYENFDNIKSEEYQHHNWIKEQLYEYREILKKIPKFIYFNNIHITHYAFQDNRFLKPVDMEILENYEKKFKNIKAKKVIFGHSHEKDEKDIYYCLGSSGCVKDDKTFYTELIIGNKISLKRIYLDYDRKEFINKLNSIDYPGKEIFKKIFFGL